MYKIVIDSKKLNIRSEYIFSKSTLNCEIRDKILEFLPSGTDNSINMEDIQKAIVPIVKNIDIFFSYNHDDEIQVKRLAEFFIRKGYRVFLDCLFWKSIDEALDNFNMKYNKNLNGSFDYTKSKLASSTFNMILSDSIIETVKNSKVFVYVKSDSSEKDSRTVSPWIYLENKIANSVSVDKVKLFEDSKPNPKILFKLDTYGYHIVNNAIDIINIVKEII